MTLVRLRLSAPPRGYLTLAGVPVIRELEFSHINVTEILLSLSLKIFLELEWRSVCFSLLPHFSQWCMMATIPKLPQKLPCNQHDWLTMKVSSLIKALNSVISEDPHQVHGIQTMSC